MAYMKLLPDEIVSFYVKKKGKKERKERKT
jgi:hypothetical protein